MTRDELVEAGVGALADVWSETTDTDEDFAGAVIDAILPLITEAIAQTIEAKVADEDAPRIAREWRPTP